MTLFRTRVGLHLALFFFSLIFGGCREDAGPGALTPSAPLVLSFRTGDRFLYDTWLLDTWGYIVPKSKATAVWHVTGTDAWYKSRTGVVTILDSSTSSSDSTVVLDTLYLSVDSSGDVFQYGFLSKLARRREQRSLPARWDRIAAFSGGFRNAWTVGYWDSAGTRPVAGQISGTSELFSVRVNGVQTVFPGYRVDLEGEALDYTFWVAASPRAVLEIYEDSHATVAGRYRELRELTTLR